MIADY
jgi:signal recognition particle subunit SRP54